MIRKAFRMAINPGAELEYERRHTPIWPELAAVLKAHGVSNYSIFLDPRDGTLFGYVEVQSEEQWAKIAETTECRNWWAHMAEIMPHNPDNSPASVELAEMFHLP